MPVDHDEPRRVADAVRTLGLAPVIVTTSIWYPRLAAGGFTSPTVWISTPTARLSFSWLADGLFGGIRGPNDFGIVAILALWVLLACVQHKGWIAMVDREMFTASAMFFALVLLLPDQRTNTVLFSVRWLPIAGALALLASPPVRGKRLVTSLVSLGLLVVVCSMTVSVWREFESNEMSGLAESLAAMPEQPKVIGLDFVRYSPIVEGRPFLQTFAYAQVLRGGRLNFSFAEFVPSLVVFRESARPPWTNGLEWFPERFQLSDLSFFDYALINGDDAIHRRFSSLPGIRTVTDEGRWRLYRITGQP